MKDPQSNRINVKQRYNYQSTNKSQMKHSVNANQFFQSPKVMNIQHNVHPTVSSKHLKQHIDVTVTQFSIKCSMLINQIEEMKNEFIAQIEGVLPLMIFPKQSGKVFGNRNMYVNTNDNQLPFISNSNKTGTAANDKRIKYSEQSVIISNRKNIRNRGNCYSNGNNNNITNTNNTNSSLLYSDNNIINHTASSIKGCKSKEMNINQNTQEDQGNFGIKKISDFNYMNEDDSDEDKVSKKTESVLNKKSFQIQNVNEIKYSQKEQIQNKKQFNKNALSNKTKALICLINLNYIDYQDILKIKFLNKELYNACDKTQSIVSNVYHRKLRELDTIQQLIPAIPSLTSTSNLCFIIKQYENDLIDDSKPTNTKFYALTNILLNRDNNSNNNISCKEQYKSILQFTKSESMRQLYLSSILKNIVSEVKKIQMEKMVKYVDFYESNKCCDFLEQKDLVERNEIFMSMIGFIMNDIYVMFKNEIEKRKQMQCLDREVKALKQKMKK